METTQSSIAIDVSKGCSYVCGYAAKDKMIQEPIKILHDREGFAVLDDLYLRLTTQTGTNPIFVYETTGVYHRPLERYLTQHDYPQIKVSPLLAAKHRKNSGIRVPKSDKSDPKSLARLFYDLELCLNPPSDERYYELLQLDRFYVSLTRLMVTCKIHFHEKLAILFPRMGEHFLKMYAPYHLDLLATYPHPEIILKKRVDTLEHRLIESGIQNRRAHDYAKKLKEFSQGCVPGTSSNSNDAYILRTYIKQIQFYENERAKTIERMIELGKELQFFKQLQSIPGVGSVLAIRLIAELGDLSRFTNERQLVAYAGLDPIVYQSGQFDGKHLAISKKGNHHLRSILFQILSISAQVETDHSLKQYVQKKRQTHANKSALIAGCVKLLRIIFSLYRSGQMYSF